MSSQTDAPLSEPSTSSGIVPVIAESDDSEIKLNIIKNLEYLLDKLKQKSVSFDIWFIEKLENDDCAIFKSVIDLLLDLESGSNHVIVDIGAIVNIIDMKYDPNDFLIELKTIFTFVLNCLKRDSDQKIAQTNLLINNVDKIVESLNYGTLKKILDKFNSDPNPNTVNVASVKNIIEKVHAPLKTKPIKKPRKENFTKSQMLQALAKLYGKQF